MLAVKKIQSSSRRLLLLGERKTQGFAASVRSFCALKKSIKEMLAETEEESKQALEKTFEGFDVAHTPGSAIIEMVKASGSETITVRSDVRAGAAEALDMDGFEQLEEGDANGEDGGDVDLGNPLELRFDVHVSKEHCENEMTFECVFRHDEFEIVDLAVGPEDVGEDDYVSVPTYRFPDELVEDLYVYLEERGVTNDLACFLADSAETIHGMELHSLVKQVDDFLEK
mmetsp:Transcript_13957/g.22793  ORF Transcript_13957/g.22793 Transcript_13957/m.22793 type:complete len:228 (+) Transcript_13957:25-708(+)